MEYSRKVIRQNTHFPFHDGLVSKLMKNPITEFITERHFLCWIAPQLVWRATGLPSFICQCKYRKWSLLNAYHYVFRVRRTQIASGWKARHPILFLSLNENQAKTHCKKRILPMLVLGQADRRRQASTICLRFNSCNSGITDSNCETTTSSDGVRPLARSQSGNFPFLVQKQ